MNWYDRNEGKLQEHVELLRSKGIEHGRQLWRIADLKDANSVIGRLGGFMALVNQRTGMAAAVKRLPFRLSESEAALAFDETFGSVSGALNAEVLPTRYFESVQKPPAKEVGTIVQLLPTQAPTWLLMGDAFDDRYLAGDQDPNETEQLLPIARWFEQPALVRRVECYALMEAKYVDEPARTPYRWMEPVLHLTAKDQHALMSDQLGPMFRYHTMGDPTLGHCLDGGGGERTLPASRYIALMTNSARAQRGVSMFPPIPQHTADDDGSWHLWTHVLVADRPPAEVGFSRGRDPEAEIEEEEW